LQEKSGIICHWQAFPFTSFSLPTEPNNDQDVLQDKMPQLWEVDLEGLRKAH